MGTAFACNLFHHNRHFLEGALIRYKTYNAAQKQTVGLHIFSNPFHLHYDLPLKLQHNTRFSVAVEKPSKFGQSEIDEF